MDTIYKEELLEHYHSPLHFEKLKSYDKSSRQLNPFCGDEIEIFIKFDKNTIEDISFQGKGCVICMAATSLLTDFAKGKPKSKLTKFSQEDMLNLLGVEVSEARKKCAFLGLSVLEDCL